MNTPVLSVSLSAAVAACIRFYPTDNPRYWSRTHPTLLASVLTKALVQKNKSVSINEQGKDDAQLGRLVRALADPFEAWWQSTYAQAFTHSPKIIELAHKEIAEAAWRASRA